MELPFPSWPGSTRLCFPANPKLLRRLDDVDDRDKPSVMAALGSKSSEPNGRARGGPETTSSPSLIGGALGLRRRRPSRRSRAAAPRDLPRSPTRQPRCEARLRTRPAPAVPTPWGREQSTPRACICQMGRGSSAFQDRRGSCSQTKGRCCRPTALLGLSSPVWSWTAPTTRSTATAAWSISLMSARRRSPIASSNAPAASVYGCALAADGSNATPSVISPPAAFLRPMRPA